MSKTKLLLDVVSDLRSIADSLQALAEALTANEPVETEEPKTKVPTPEPEPKPITLEQVRAMLAEKSYDGFTAEIRGLLEKHGVKKLSEMDPSEFPSLLAEAEALR